jgi:hypothetical protein
MKKTTRKESCLKSLGQSPRAFFAFTFVLFFLVWIGLETEVFARAGGGGNFRCPAGSRRRPDHGKIAVHLKDDTVAEQSGQVLSGNPQDPLEFTESCTFSRNLGERNWVLAGISQNSVQ